MHVYFTKNNAKRGAAYTNLLNEASSLDNFLKSAITLEMLGRKQSPHSTNNFRISGSVTMLDTVSAKILCMFMSKVPICCCMDGTDRNLIATESMTMMKAISKNLLMYSKRGEEELAEVRCICFVLQS